jgi:hypothetical protein
MSFARISHSMALFVATLFLAAPFAQAADPAPVAPATTGKLVIVKAYYGDLPDGAKTDVTEKVTAMVKDNALSVEASNDNFGDPADGITKKLKVDYTIDGKAKSKIINEGETLKLTAKPSKIVIKKAFYGDLPDGAKTDVTEKVADMLNGDTLSVEATNTNFGDPVEGTGKKLKIDYTFDGGKEQSKTVDENQTLTISDKGE